MAEQKDVQAAFLEAVEGLKEYAKVNGGSVTKEDVTSYFKGIDMDESKLSMIYGYLMANNIRVLDASLEDNLFLQMMEQAEAPSASEQQNQPEGATEAASDTLDYEADEKYLNMYLEDLKGIDAMSDTSRAFLLLNIVEDNDRESLKLLSESFLEKIVDWIKPFQRRGVLASDLVQEANLAMMAYVGQKQFLKHYEWKDGIREGSAEEVLAILENIEKEVRSEVEESLAMLIDEQRQEKQITERVLNKVNLVNDWAKRLKENLGRKPTPAEVAEKIGISVESVNEAVQLSAEAIENIAYTQK